MKVIKKIILKGWLKSFSTAFLTLFVLFSVANLISEFLRGRAEGTDILLHYLLELPKWLTKIIPISCLVASVFSVNKLKKKSELIAIFASGFSTRKYILLIFQLSLGVAIMQFLLSAYIAPFCKSMRPVLMKGQEIHFRSNKAKGIKFSSIGSGRIWYKKDNFFASFDAFDKYKTEIKNLSIYYYDILSGQVSRIIKAGTATHVEQTKWKLKKAEVIEGVDKKDFQIEETINEKIVDLNASKIDFLEIESDVTTMNIAKLYFYTSRLKKLGIKVHEYEILIFEMISNSLFCFIFALLAIKGIYIPSSRGQSFGKSASNIFIFIMGFWLVQNFMITLGSNGYVNTFLASFTTIFLLIVAIGMMMKKNHRLV